jgi:HAD superfamily hydrolase (TIGR01549 family)
MSFEKEKKYQQDFRPHLKLVDGLHEFLERSFKEGKKMAIGSAAIRFNVDFVLDGLNIRHYFDAIVCADDVKTSKPDPETWQACAEKLGIHEKDCIVFEDAPKGVEAALRARMDSIVITTLHTKEEFDEYPNIRGFIADFRELAGHPVN